MTIPASGARKLLQVVGHPLRDESDATDVRVVDGFLSCFGGISFRLDSRRQTVARAIDIAIRAPGFALRNAFPYARHWARRCGGGNGLRGLLQLATGRTTAHPRVVVSHHFMNLEEMLSPVGQERLAHCIVHVPVNGKMVSMCEVNASGLREQYYASLRPTDDGAHETDDWLAAQPFHTFTPPPTVASKR